MSAWHNATTTMLIEYQLDVHNHLVALSDVVPTSKEEIDTYLDTIVKVIMKSSDNHIPKAQFLPHVKPYWTPDVKQAHTNARSKRQTWVREGKPRGMMHESYKQYKIAKAKFRDTNKRQYLKAKIILLLS